MSTVTYLSVIWNLISPPYELSPAPANIEFDIPAGEAELIYEQTMPSAEAEGDLPVAELESDQLAHEQSIGEQITNTANVGIDDISDAETVIYDGRRRRKKSNPTMCKQNMRKRARQSGKNYINTSGICVQARRVVQHQCGQCVNRCNEILIDEQREEIFHSYWRMGDHNRQRDFICSHGVRIEKKMNKTETVDEIILNTIYSLWPSVA